jgi:hypothetical protein
MLKFIISLVLLSNTNSQINDGQCTNNDNCLSFGSDYSCISVQTNIAGLVKISKCIKGSICVGDKFGSCPNFTTWTTKYQVLKPECSFSLVQNCKNKNSNNNTVDCYNSASDNTVYGIYRCVDANTIKVNNNSTILVTESPIPEFPDTNTTQINSTITDIPITETPSNSTPATSDFKTTNKYISVIACIAINLIVMNYI